MGHELQPPIAAHRRIAPNRSERANADRRSEPRVSHRTAAGHEPQCPKRRPSTARPHHVAGVTLGPHLRGVAPIRQDS
eukprot:681970-Alexandrium_andersonii.AAC.1